VAGATRSDTGAWGEALAARHLEQKGYAILARNWRPAAGNPELRLKGEIDIVAQHGDALVFVEVRTRHGHARGAPEESITPRKRTLLIDAAQAYLASTLDDFARDSCAWRIDVIAVDLDERNAVLRLSHIQHAVTAS
jgi:putative endonuclease